MSPPPSRRGRLGPEARGARAGRAWSQLAFLLVALVVLLFFMSQIGERSAGCFASLTGPAGTPAPADARGSGASDDASAKPHGPQGSPQVPPGQP